MDNKKENNQNEISKAEHEKSEEILETKPGQRPKEIGGPKGPEPTRYGDWEKKGRCIDF